MKPQTAMVCLLEHQWTQNALHLACALARTRGLEIVLVKMIRVQHLAWLGTELGHQDYVEENYDQLCGYESIAQEYNVPFSATFFQYHSGLSDALVDAAAHVGARVVFATLPDTSPAFWRKFQRGSLERKLMRQQCQLLTLEKPADTSDWMPSVTVPAFRK